MLPTKLHKTYHFLKRTIETDNLKITTEITSIALSGIGHNEYVINNIQKFINCWEECCKWNDYKYYLLGVIPNIHRIEVGD